MKKGRVDGMLIETETNKTDHIINEITDYVVNKEITSEEAFETAKYVLFDTIGCGMLALQYPACTKLLGPYAEGTIVPNGVKIPGTSYVLDPVKAAFDIGAMIRWLDYNDTDRKSTRLNSSTVLVFI